MNRRFLAPIAVVVLLSFILGPSVLVLLVAASVYSAPLIAAVWFLRKRLSPTTSRLLLAIGFGAGVGYKLWQTEWFDVWRWGVPSATYLATVFLPYVAAAAGAGWVFEPLLTPPTAEEHDLSEWTRG